MKQERRRFSQVIFTIAILHILIYTVCCLHGPAQQFLIRDSINFGQIAPEHLSCYSESGSLYFSQSFAALLALSQLQTQLDFREHSIILESLSLLDSLLALLKRSLRQSRLNTGISDTLKQASLEFASSTTRTSARY